MRSAAVLDRWGPIADAPEARDLLVLWQHPQTLEIIPIGRLNHDGDCYSFSYTAAAADIPDFRPLPGLPDLRHPYVSDRIPAVFGQRVMSPNRPDYIRYLHSLGLDPSRATPWEQIVQSGGARAGDTLHVMEVPVVVGQRAHARFLASGLRHIPDGPLSVSGQTLRVSTAQQEAALAGLRPGSVLKMTAEDNNPQDRHATLIEAGGVPVGWIPRTLSPSVRELMNSQAVALTVVRVGAPGAPPHVRLVLDLDVEAPQGFAFDREGRWRPIDG